MIINFWYPNPDPLTFEKFAKAVLNVWNGEYM